MEKFSLKINWKLTEGLLYNQNYKKDICNHVGSKEKQLSWNLCP